MIRFLQDNQVSLSHIGTKYIVLSPPPPPTKSFPSKLIVCYTTNKWVCSPCPLEKGGAEWDEGCEGKTLLVTAVRFYQKGISLFLSCCLFSPRLSSVQTWGSAWGQGEGVEQPSCSDKDTTSKNYWWVIITIRLWLSKMLQSDWSATPSVN